MPRFLVLAFLCCGLMRPGPVQSDRHIETGEAKLRTQIRRPIALVANGDQVLVGNRNSGSVTVIDRRSRKILAEHFIARRIADLARVPASPDVFVLDDDQNELLRVSIKDAAVEVHRIAKLPFAGVKMIDSPSSQTIFISGRWRHAVMRLDLDPSGRNVTKAKIVEIPFTPRDLLFAREKNRLLVSSAFSNQVAIIDPATGSLVGLREIEGHNLRGLAVSASGKQLLIAHQQMPAKALADYEELHWGRMVSNAVEVFDLEDFLAGGFHREAKGWLDAQGGIGRALGDPGNVIAGPDDLVAVAFSGVGEVSLRRKGSLKRITVDAHPEAMAIAENELFVANRFADSASVIDLKQETREGAISLGPSPKPTSEERGEALFYNAKLSHDGWMSCHSCHTDGHTAGLVVDTLGDGDYGAAKLVPSLLGTRDTLPWGWDGNTSLFREQIQKSVTTTMHGESLDLQDLEDLAAFLGSLDVPPPAKKMDPDLIKKGQAVFTAEGCANCHAPPAFTTPVVVDVGLKDELKRSQFNPPSLRGVSQRRRFFHDGRAKSLEDVLFQVEHQRNGSLSQDDAKALLAFLRSL